MLRWPIVSAACLLLATPAVTGPPKPVESEWLAAHPDSTVVRRDLAADPVPATAWQDAVAAGFTARPI